MISSFELPWQKLQRVNLCFLQKECWTCPSGKYQPDIHLAYPQCKTCPWGKYSSNQTGFTECAVCTLNSFTEATCAGCPAGYYDNGSGVPSFVDTSGCESCPIGKFATEVGQESCEQCATSGFTTGGNITRCLYCPFGKFIENGVSATDTSYCKMCPLGESIFVYKALHFVEGQ